MVKDLNPSWLIYFTQVSLIVSTHLHLLYLVTPYDIVKDLNSSWPIYFTQVSLIQVTPYDIVKDLNPSSGKSHSIHTPAFSYLVTPYDNMVKDLNPSWLIYFTQVSLIVSTHLHLLYLVTPYNMVKDLNPS